MLQFPPISPRGTGPLRSHLYDKVGRAQLNFATWTSPLVEVFDINQQTSADGLFFVHRPLVGNMYRYLQPSSETKRTIKLIP